MGRDPLSTRAAAGGSSFGWPGNLLTVSPVRRALGRLRKRADAPEPSIRVGVLAECALGGALHVVAGDFHGGLLTAAASFIFVA